MSKKAPLLRRFLLCKERGIFCRFDGKERIAEAVFGKIAISIKICILCAQEIPLLGIYTEDTIKDVHDENVCWNIFYSRETLEVQGDWQIKW